MSNIAPPELGPPPPSFPPAWTAPPRRTWTTGATASLLLGVVMVISAGALVIGAGVVRVIDHDRRQGDYLTTDTADLATDGYALTVEDIDLDGLSGDWLLGEARVRVTAVDSGDSVFVGIASAEDAADYLDDVNHSTVVEIDDSSPEYEHRRGGAPAVAPTDVDIWTAQASGTGTQALEWTPSEGDWTVVVMNRDGTAAVQATTDLGATVPILGTVQRWSVGGGLVAGVLGLGLIAWTTIRTRPRRSSTLVG